MLSTKKELFACKNKKSIEKVWKNHNVNTFPEKVKALKECMGNPLTFYCSGKEMDAEREYALELGIFLLGEWRIIDLYKKAGIKK